MNQHIDSTGRENPANVALLDQYKKLAEVILGHNMNQHIDSTGRENPANVALLDQYKKLAEVILGFADAVEGLLKSEFAYPFLIGSDALRDCAADSQHCGTRSTQVLTNLATSQVRAGYVQCDLHRGVAAALPAPKVFFSPFPLARTSVVVAAKPWFVTRRWRAGGTPAALPE